MLITQRAEFMSVIKNNPDGVTWFDRGHEEKNLNIIVVNKIYFWVGPEGLEPPTTPL